VLFFNIKRNDKNINEENAVPWQKGMAYSSF
jgi:hypothetical protein